MTHSKASEFVPAGAPAYIRNGYRFYEQADGTWQVMDGQGEDARHAASFALLPGSSRPTGIRLHGLYSTQRVQLEDLIEKFAQREAQEEVTHGG